jgi:Na+/H+-dicarboxylate symporter
MKKLKRGLFPKVVIAIVIGALLGLILPDVVNRIFKTFNDVIIPFLPVYIFTMICEMSAKGVIDVVLDTGFKVILTGVILSILYLVVQYCIAGIIARKNPLKMIWNIIPAYLTGFSDTITTLMMTIYLALDGYGPAVNVSGDAAIAVIADKLFGGKKNAAESAEA